MAGAEAIGVGMLGYAFMGKAHSRAFLAQPTLDTPLRPELVSISGWNAEKVEEARRRYEWAEAVRAYGLVYGALGAG
jgi:predicted dehydrogenase